MAGPDPRSRYTGLPTVEAVLPDGQTVRLGVPRLVTAVPSTGTYQVRAGDRLDLLALRLYGDTTLWWRFADANRFADPTRLEGPGTEIELPHA